MVELLERLKKAIFGLTAEDRQEGVYALTLLEDTDMMRHYRWVCLSDLNKALKKNIVSSDVPTAVSQVSWLQQCAVTGCNYNLFKIRLKNGEYCHMRVKTALGNLLKKSQQVFTKDGDINWSKVRVVKFLPVGKKIYFDNKGYELAQENNNLVVRRFYPH